MYTHIMHHHSASGENTTMKDILAWHKARGFYTYGYNFIIFPDGRVENGRILGVRGAHCKDGNMNALAIGVCLIGDFTKYSPTSQQYESVVKLDKRLMSIYKIPIEGLTQHNAYSNTACPGKGFDLSRIKRELGGVSNIRDYTYNEELKRAVLNLNKLGVLQGYTSDSAGIPLIVKPKEAITNERLYILLNRLIEKVVSR